MIYGRMLSSAFILLAACQDASAPQADHDVAAVEITVDNLKMPDGDEVQLHAVARRTSGEPVTDAVITWTSSEPTILRITPNGYATMVGVSDENSHVRVVWIKAAARNGAADSLAIDWCGVGGFTGLRLQGNVQFGELNQFEHTDVAARFDGAKIVNAGGFVMVTANASASSGSTPLGGISGDRVGFGGARRCDFDRPEGAYTRSILAVGDSTGPLPVRIEQETFVPVAVANGSSMLLRFTVTNVSKQPITGARFGFPFTWDLRLNPETSSLNRSRYNAALHAAEAYLPGLETAGIASISEEPTSYRAARALYSADRTPLQVSNLLGEGILPQTSPGDVPYSDVDNMLGFGSYDLAAGETRSITLVVTAGRSREEFANNVAAARAVASSFPNDVRSQ